MKGAHSSGHDKPTPQFVTAASDEGMPLRSLWVGGGNTELLSDLALASGIRFTAATQVSKVVPQIG